MFVNKVVDTSSGFKAALNFGHFHLFSLQSLLETTQGPIRVPLATEKEIGGKIAKFRPGVQGNLGFSKRGGGGDSMRTESMHIQVNEGRPPALDSFS